VKQRRATKFAALCLALSICATVLLFKPLIGSVISYPFRSRPVIFSRRLKLPATWIVVGDSQSGALVHRNLTVLDSTPVSTAVIAPVPAGTANLPLESLEQLERLSASKIGGRSFERRTLAASDFRLDCFQFQVAQWHASCIDPLSKTSLLFQGSYTDLITIYKALEQSAAAD
jgi:hypothetical protein